MLKSQEIMAQLSLKEWSQLCHMVDEFGPAQIIRFQHGNGSDVQTVKGQLIQKKFGIVKIVRTGQKTLCWLDFGAGKMQCYQLGTGAGAFQVSSEIRLEQVA